MNTLKYVLRANHFVYHDDAYRLQEGDERSPICGVFDDETSALQAWKVLEHQIILQRPMQQIADFTDMSANKLAQLDDLVFTYIGKRIVDDYDCENVLAELNAEQLFEFLKLAHLHSYQLIKVPSDQLFYVCWIAKKQAYLTANRDDELDRQVKSVLHYDSADELLRRYVHEFAAAPYGEMTDDEDGAFEQHGTLSEISHDPEALQQLINRCADLRYNPDTKTLLIDYDVDTLNQVYPLLKQAPLEIRSVTIEQLFEIQQNNQPFLLGEDPSVPTWLNTAEIMKLMD